jgi:hypothetical protein
LGSFEEFWHPSSSFLLFISSLFPYLLVLGTFEEIFGKICLEKFKFSRFRTKSMNPLDYCYISLNVNFEVLDKENPEFTVRTFFTPSFPSFLSSSLPRSLSSLPPSLPLPPSYHLLLPSSLTSYQIIANYARNTGGSSPSRVYKIQRKGEPEKFEKVCLAEEGEGVRSSEEDRGGWRGVEDGGG